jgi:MFS family permease
MLKIPGNLVLFNSRTRSLTDFSKTTDNSQTNCATIATTEIVPSVVPQRSSKDEIRTSLKASTWDGIFAAFFCCVTTDILLINFLLALGASSVEIGLLAAIPMFANFLQPIGAYFADRSNSRHKYILQIFAPARLLWTLLILAIVGYGFHFFSASQLIYWTLAIVLITHVCGAMGSASWLSWMAVLVPKRLRGRYFGLRNGAAKLINLLCVPLLGMAISHWQGGIIQGYGLVLILAVVAGIISLSFQGLMVDVNPQANRQANNINNKNQVSSLEIPAPSVPVSLLKETNFLKYLGYCGLWTFAVNLSLPFFNVYLLKDLGLTIDLVTIYNSLAAGANVLLLPLWGKLADRIGNRLVLIVIGSFVAILPLFWLGIAITPLSLWLWLPLLYLLSGSAWSAIELCLGNLQIAVAPCKQSSSYFAIVAAVSGLGGALGTTAGGFFSQYVFGTRGLFILSAMLSAIAVLLLILVREPGRQSFLTLTIKKAHGQEGTQAGGARVWE